VSPSAAAAAVDHSLRQIHFAEKQLIKNTLKKNNQKSVQNNESKIR
jgi:hypothetical protein